MARTSIPNVVLIGTSWMTNIKSHFTLGAGFDTRPGCICRLRMEAQAVCTIPDTKEGTMAQKTVSIFPNFYIIALQPGK